MKTPLEQYLDTVIGTEERERQLRSIEKLAMAGVLEMRTKRITSGRMIECMVYPHYARETDADKRAKRKAETNEAQKKLNEMHQKMAFRRTLECNFSGGDTFCTLTFGKPVTMAEAKKAIRRLRDRINRERKKQGKENVKYLGVIERGAINGRVHVHMAMEGDVSREQLESWWGVGYCATSRIREDFGGMQRLANYMEKQMQLGGRTKNVKAYIRTRNLKQPKVSTSKSAISKRQAVRIAEDFDGIGQEIIYRKFKDYEIETVVPYRCAWTSGIFIYIRMYKRGEHDAQ